MSTAIDTGRSTAAGPKKAKLSDRARGERSLGWKLAGPAFLVMLFVTLYPIVYAIYLSLFNYRLTDPTGRRFVFLGNYVTALGDPLFWQAFVTTFIIVIVTLIFELILGMGIAMVMNKIVIPRRTLRTVVLIPYSIITVVSAFSWLYAAKFDTGFFNHWLNFFTFGAWDLNYDWFGGRWSSLLIICLSEIWKTTPFMSLLLLAGLAQVDSAQEEAAKVDGATWWQRLTKVILPNMKAALMVAVLFRTLDAVRIYDNPYVMTGGANKTLTLSMLVGTETIDRVEIGMGSALAVILFLIVLIIAFIFVKLFKVDLTGGRN
ncbi:sugar ABC transporter permease [Calidifontibacter sp. DB0510]|uniref:Sugar ABC transporter permease n=1 Tax=Metallococcus carri TaxID=1656884 RepID=A0A967AZB4_9MICO|nr:sugar ABC transporter permease [Metallococcus carri]NHN55134.1 sugar ABC transporter permease [Metallococcus carri]NOP36211.1 sugar ABC transporter permease [Calidifontibacter sp. DB2511S]